MIDWKFIYEKWLLGHHRYPVPEAAVRKVMKGIRGEVFVDVGANIGDYTFLLKRNFGLIIAVEPNPDAMKLLRSNRRLSDKIITVQSAMCEYDGETTLYLNRDRTRCNGSADTIEPVFYYRPESSPEIDMTTHEDYGVTVKAERFDSLADFYIGPYLNIDLVKIDVEGAEFRVLQGMDNTMEEITNIIVELHDRERKREMTKIITSQFDEVKWIDADHIYGRKTK